MSNAKPSLNTQVGSLTIRFEPQELKLNVSQSLLQELALYAGTQTDIKGNPITFARLMVAPDRTYLAILYGIHFANNAHYNPGFGWARERRYA